MKHVLCLFDKVAGQFQQPVFVPAIGILYRSLMDEVSRGGPENMLAAHPADFQVFDLGIYDEDTGTLSGNDPILLTEVSALIVPRS